MWNTIVTALLSAAAALGGVALSARLSARSQARQWDHEREQRLRDEKLKIFGEITTRSARIREVHLKLLTPGSIISDADAEQVKHDYQDLRNLLSTLRLTARNFTTVSTVLDLAEDAALVINNLGKDGATAQVEVASATLRLAAMRLHEQVLVELARDELDLEGLVGMPKYDEEAMLRAFLKKALADDKAVERTFVEIQQIQNRKKDAGWLAK
ncbi:hypothetical protein ACSDR0_50550 [Streptosporangium sp. G11]|uniref:hypothetical protein n=1 Tax=Streptosporangium sp. G11 TaxID=3436926 RepID=UPI003EB794E3